MTSIEELYQLFVEHPVVTTDSRNCPQNALFFALKGENFDGNIYAQKAIEAGASYAIIDNHALKQNDRYIVVDNVLDTLQRLAAHHRKQFAIPVIGVTGTNGKTTTKELTAAVLSKRYNTLYTQGNLNNHIGVPLTLLQLNSSHQMAIIEMGANHPGEIKSSVAIAQPTHGIITNVGKAHIEGFGSFDNILKTKGELYDYLREHSGTIFINSNNEHLARIAQGLPQIAYSTATNADICGKVVSYNPHVVMQWSAGNASYTVGTNLIGGYNLENMLTAICIGHHFGVSHSDICNALAEYKPKNNRSQMTTTDKNELIVDTYNANPTSMTAALENFKHIGNVRRKVVILGDMLELGSASLEEHSNIVKLLSTIDLQQTLLVGSEFKKVATPKQLTFDHVGDLIAWLQEHPITNSCILIKGSHGIHLEKTVASL